MSGSQDGEGSCSHNSTCGGVKAHLEGTNICHLSDLAGPECKIRLGVTSQSSLDPEG